MATGGMKWVVPLPLFVCCFLLGACRPQQPPHAAPDTTAEGREGATEPGLDGWLLQGQAASAATTPSPYSAVASGPTRPGAAAGTGRGTQLRRPMTSRSLPTPEGFLWNAGFEHR